MYKFTEMYRYRQYLTSVTSQRVINLQVEMHVYGTLPAKMDNEVRVTIFYMKTFLYYFRVQERKWKMMEVYV